MIARVDRTDHELLKAYAEARDVESLGAFIARHQDSVLRFARKLLGDADGAQDVVQETFIQVARRPDRLLAVSSCHNWLLKVARNLGISQLRRRARHAKRLQAAAPGRTADAEEREAAGRQVLETEEAHARVRAEIEKLHPRHRELLVLKVAEGKSYREIAEITGLTVTNVGYHLHHAMKELSRRLGRARDELA